MKLFTTIATVIAIALIIFNATKLDFDAIFKGDSSIALITIFCSLCVITLLQIFRISKKIEKLDKKRR